jgi:hypothetical protein
VGCRAGEAAAVATEGAETGGEAVWENQRGEAEDEEATAGALLDEALLFVALRRPLDEAVDIAMVVWCKWPCYCDPSFTSFLLSTCLLLSGFSLQVICSKKRSWIY